MGFKHDPSEILAVIRPLLQRPADQILEGPKERGAGTGQPLDPIRRFILAAEVEALKVALSALIDSGKYAVALEKVKTVTRRWMDPEHFGVGGIRSMEQDGASQWLTSVNLGVGSLLKLQEASTTKGGLRD